MSTISLPYEKQIRHFFLATAIAGEASIQAFIDNAEVGEIQIFDKDGQKIDFQSGELIGDFRISKKNNKGSVSTSDLITPKDIKYLTGSAPVAKVGKKQTFTLAGAPTAGKHYILDLKVHYGNSEENFISFRGDALAKNGDTAVALLTRLAKSVADNLGDSVNTRSKSGDTYTIVAGTDAKTNKYFTITVSGSELSIQEKDWILEDFRVGLRTHDQLMWNAEVMVPGSDTEQLNVTKGEVPQVYAKGQGYQIIELERYLVGHRAEFETKDITLSFGRKYDTDINAQYYVLEMKYFDITDDPKHADKMLTLVSTDPKVLDTIGYAIEAAQGKAEGTVWTELDPAQDGADNVA